MPTYVYKCNDCAYDFEARQRMSDEPLTVCPQCEGELRRVINSVGVVFKGSGFYVTDSRERVNGTTAGNGKGESKSEKPKSESETSSKSDKKTGKSDKSE